MTTLSPRQQQILNARSQGKPLKEVAYDLGLSLKTAQWHWMQIKIKLGMESADPVAICRLVWQGKVGAVAALMLLAVTCLGGDVRLAWDASPTEGITNYVLYANNMIFSTPSPTNLVHINVGTNLTCTIEGLDPGRWYFAATAMKDGLESDISNVIEVEVPAPPANMRTVIVQYSGTLTNFQDVGFFRLRIGIP